MAARISCRNGRSAAVLSAAWMFYGLYNESASASQRCPGPFVRVGTAAHTSYFFFYFFFLEKPTTYAGLRVAPHDSCYDHYDGYLSLCVMRSPPLRFVGHAVQQQQLPLGFIVE